MNRPPNHALLGLPGGRQQMATPALLLDLDAFEANLARMAAHCRRHGIAVRPHAKTHKSLTIARRQMAAGAVGLSCATLGETEMLAHGGIPSILITSPVVTAANLRRLGMLTAGDREVMVVVDHPDNIQALSGLAAGLSRKLRVLIDLDVGMGRTGVVPGPAALVLADLVAAAPGLAFAGIQAYAGHLMHVPGTAAREQACIDAMAPVAELRRHWAQQGRTDLIFSGGGTGSFDIDPGIGVLTELQAGSYLFMERMYEGVWSGSDEAVPFQTALWVQASVVSTSRPGHATLDAGFKAVSPEAGPPPVASGLPPGSVTTYLGDEHLGVTLPPGAAVPALGTPVTLAIPHCDPTVNLHRHYHVVQGDRLIDLWPIEAAGSLP
ncbi:DSD1 family PLP-dependent enzyme [Niveispirillum sp.]|uniref:DSD1 family PLP-dependent enzyme n=1 Tax=Niveispirillum sp. TaxID=1917217 RepID=UPI001B5D5212|nr:DSD1 family PLP-dependent enzyme [Niveispirillum sp.]MBP7337169.1 DSD1 family PLP-dependent enzyme [Niveispirillum sp.]